MFGGTGNVFGQKSTTPLTFGAPAASGGLFGAPATTQPQSTINFNFPAATTTTQPTTGFNFQAQPQAGTGLQTTGFAPSAQPTLFGVSPVKPATQSGLTFGTPAAQPNLSFGITPTTQASTGLGFGLTTPSSTTTTGLSFGLSTTTTPSTGLGFGLPTTATATTSPALNFNLGSNTTAPTLGTQLPTFGLGTTTAQQTFSLGSTLTTPTSQPALNFSLSKPQTTTAPLSFGLTPTATTSSVPTFGLIPTPAATTATTTTQATGSGGITSLGKPSTGINPLSSLTTLDVARADKSDSAKDQPVHQELINCLNNLREVIKTQKRYSSELARGSVKPITKVKQDAELLKRVIGQLERDLNVNKSMNRKLKSDLDRSVQDAETLHRLIDNPRVFPCDNSLAFEYFQNIIERFQEQTETLSIELKNMERHVGCRMNPPIPFTPEELAASMKRLYECFVALAGRYQSIHSSITALKLEAKRRKDSMCK